MARNGWRYYLTPALQSRFGARRGALAVGVLWGLWHLPLNLFFYSPDTSLQSIAAQLVVCVTLGVFFTFAYEKCGKNIWLPVVLHYLNNSMVLVWTGTADISNQIISWTMWQSVPSCMGLYSCHFWQQSATARINKKQVQPFKWGCTCF